MIVGSGMLEPAKTVRALREIAEKAERLALWMSDEDAESFRKYAEELRQRAATIERISTAVV